MRASLLVLLPLLACGGAPFVAGDLAVNVDAGVEAAVDSGSAAADDAEASEAAAPPPPARDGGHMADASDPDARDEDARSELDASDGASIDADGGIPPPDAAEAGAVDPQTYVCGTMSADGTAPDPSQRGWWASEAGQTPDGGLQSSHCSALTPQSASGASFPYTCDGLLAVWTCPYWLGTGTTVGCHPNALNPAILQVDCVVQ